MRLIDADKLPATCTLTIVNGNIELTGWIAAEIIEEAPTVEAIPVEWIEEWGWKNGMSESMSLRVMIDDWEKENETN